MEERGGTTNGHELTRMGGACWLVLQGGTTDGHEWERRVEQDEGLENLKPEALEGGYAIFLAFAFM